MEDEKTFEGTEKVFAPEFKLDGMTEIVDGKEVEMDISKLGLPEEKPLTDRYVPRHKLKGRTVTDSDIARVAEEAHVMYQLCFIPHGITNGGVAIAHPQIDDKDPLSFFVTRGEQLVVNPEIINHTKVPVNSVEGCMTFADKQPITVQRFHKIQVRFQTLMNIDGEDGKLKMVLTPPVDINLSGPTAKIWEHEISHLLNHCIYDEVISAEDCLSNHEESAEE